MAAQRSKAIGDTVLEESTGTVSESSIDVTVLPAKLEVTTVDGYCDAHVSTEFTVNLGGYNNVKKVSAHFGGKYDLSKFSITEITESITDTLYLMMNDELLLAKELAPEDSYIHFIATI